MKNQAMPKPSPMSAERERVLRGRVERGEPLSRPSDQAAVTRSIAARGKKTAKDGYRVMARRIGHKSKNVSTKEAKYDDDGEAIEQWHPFAASDRYLEIVATCNGPLTAEGFQALAQFKRERGL